MYFESADGPRYAGTFIPPVDVVDGYESIIELGNRQEKIITINFPLYSDVKKLYIGLQESATLKCTNGRKIRKHTYQTAKENGDENVYFISNKELMELVGDNGSVDNTHPTDSGFLSMAQAIGKVFEKILK